MKTGQAVFSLAFNWNFSKARYKILYHQCYNFETLSTLPYLFLLFVMFLFEDTEVDTDHSFRILPAAI